MKWQNDNNVTPRHWRSSVFPLDANGSGSGVARVVGGAEISVLLWWLKTWYFREVNSLSQTSSHVPRLTKTWSHGPNTLRIRTTLALSGRLRVQGGARIRPRTSCNRYCIAQTKRIGEQRRKDWEKRNLVVRKEVTKKKTKAVVRHCWLKDNLAPTLLTV